MQMMQECGWDDGGKGVWPVGGAAGGRSITILLGVVRHGR